MNAAMKGVSRSKIPAAEPPVSDAISAG